MSERYYRITFASKDTGEKLSAISFAPDEIDAVKFARRRLNLSDRWIADKVIIPKPAIIEYRVQLTPAEKKWAEWALDPMEDYFQDLLKEGTIKQLPALPRIEGMALVIPTGPDVQADLLYRLREQAPDVCETDADSAQQAAARCRSALKLADKIEAATQEREMTKDPYR